MSGLFISVEAFNNASPSEQATVLRLMGLEVSSENGRLLIPSSVPVAAGGPVVLSDSQWREVLARPMHEKTLSVIQMIGTSREARFCLGDILRELGYGDDWRILSKVWGGLTKRVRSVTRRADAELIEWDRSEDVREIYGILAPETHLALRRVLGGRPKARPLAGRETGLERQRS